jgi:glycosyltransferase involved in cell wall biosynthesis
VTLDADLQNDPADIAKLMSWLDRADVVNGVRALRNDSFVRRVSSRIANSVRNRVTGESVTDVGCSLRAIRTTYLHRIKLFRGMHRFLPTLLALEGARVVEVPVSHRARSHGRSKYGVGNRLFVGLVDLLAVRWMQQRAMRYRVKRS